MDMDGWKWNGNNMAVGMVFHCCIVSHISKKLYLAHADAFVRILACLDRLALFGLLGFWLLRCQRVPRIFKSSMNSLDC